MAMLTRNICLRRNDIINLTRFRDSLTSVIKRSLGSDVKLENAAKEQRNVADETARSEKQDSWLSRLRLRRIETGSESQSAMLSTNESVYEMQFHSVKLEHMDEYLQDFRTFTKMISSAETGAKLLGSWTVEVGDLDEAVHLWEYDDGYPQLSNHKKLLRTEREFVEIVERQKGFLRSQKNQILLSFRFWPEIKRRDAGNIYELRSYVLRPGTLVEWGNNWARGIKYRLEEDEAVAGFFSQIGDQNNVHHLWAYKDLQTRKEVRERAWSRPGWDSCVAHTVPLIRHMVSRILIPTSFSPLQ